MLYATVTQRLSDFFPKNLPREEQAYKNYTLDRQFWPYYTDPSSGTIRYNTYVGNVVSTETYDVRVKGGYFNYIDSLDRVYNEDGTYRYNVVIGYNSLTSVNGDSNIYIGRNSNSFSINTNNTISIGQDILPENNKIILRPNPSQGQIKIFPPKSSNQIYSCDFYGNNTIVHDGLSEDIKNSTIIQDGLDENIKNSNIRILSTTQNISASNISLNDSDINVDQNSQINIGASNINSQLNISEPLTISANTNISEQLIINEITQTDTSSIKIGNPTDPSYFEINGIIYNISELTNLGNQTYITIMIGNQTYKIPIYT
jgi:hypothetical protein